MFIHIVKQKDGKPISIGKYYPGKNIVYCSRNKKQIFNKLDAWGFDYDLAKQFYESTLVIDDEEYRYIIKMKQLVDHGQCLEFKYGKQFFMERSKFRAIPIKEARNAFPINEHIS